MARQIASVHIDIARLVLEVSDYSEDSKESMEKLGRWTKQLARCLATRKPEMHEYGALLLGEVEEYRKADSERKKAKFSKESTERKPIPWIPHTDRSDRQIRSDQKREDQEKNPLPPAGDLWFSDLNFSEAWSGWIRGRKKKPTARALELSISKLREISAGDMAAAIRILDQSAAYGWTGLFPLKESSSPRFSGTAPRKAEYIP